MAIQNQALVLDLIEWIGPASRPYAEVLAAWRTSCPRLTVWEDAVDAGFVARDRSLSGQPVVKRTEAGQAFLDQHRVNPR
jgi:hypothetical protein